MSNNRQSWSDYQTAFSACKKYDGMGFMFADGICGIDIDGADGHTKSNPLQNEILQLFEGTYIERSPSGSGFHILFRCDMSRIPKTTDKDGKIKLDTRYYQKNKSNELECYFSGLTNRYFTYTGDRVSDTENITDKTEEV
ncbi:MAG: DNA primase, partial [Clostridia bacterium]|nr:DNA primase [Clostridia bacterium]